MIQCSFFGNNTCDIWCIWTLWLNETQVLSFRLLFPVRAAILDFSLRVRNPIKGVISISQFWLGTRKSRLLSTTERCSEDSTVNRLDHTWCSSFTFASCAYWNAQAYAWKASLRMRLKIPTSSSMPRNRTWDWSHPCVGELSMGQKVLTASASLIAVHQRLWILFINKRQDLFSLAEIGDSFHKANCISHYSKPTNVPLYGSTIEAIKCPDKHFTA